jgi:transposase
MHEYLYGPFPSGPALGRGRLPSSPAFFVLSPGPTANVITVDPAAPLGDHACMKPYSEDLRIRIVKAVKEGTSKSATARLFDVSLSSVKRYVRRASRGESLVPGKGGGRPPKVNQTTQKLLQEDVKKRSAVTVSERRRFLEQLTGKALSDSTIRRLLKRLGFSQKNGAWER